MPSQINYPNGIQLYSDAMSPDEMASLFQTLTAQMLGYDPTNDPTDAYNAVRVGWVQEGQPAWLITDNVCFLRATEEDVSWAKFYDIGGNFLPLRGTQEILVNGVSLGPTESISVNGKQVSGPDYFITVNGAWPSFQMEYNRVWRIHWCFYGPDCHDSARAIIDGLRLDWTHDYLIQQQIAMVTDIPRPRYFPELYEGRWWKRTDLSAEFNELVVSQTGVGTIGSAEIQVFNDRGMVLDINAAH